MKPIIKKITNNWIKQKKPCRVALDWWDKRERNPIKILKLLIRNKKYDWANWMIVRVMKYKDYVRYAVFAAEQTIDINEKKCIDDPSEKNKAARAAAWATRAAAWTVWAAAEPAWAARAAWAAAEAAGAAEVAMQLKILKYGMKLLKEAE